MYISKFIEKIPLSALAVTVVALIAVSFLSTNKAISLTAASLGLAVIALYFIREFVLARSRTKEVRDTKNLLYSQLVARFTTPGVYSYKRLTSREYVVFVAMRFRLLGPVFRIAITHLDDEERLLGKQEVAVQVSYIITRLSRVPKNTVADFAAEAGSGDSFVLRDLEKEPTLAEIRSTLHMPGNLFIADIDDLRMLTDLLKELDDTLTELHPPFVEGED